MIIQGEVFTGLGEGADYIGMDPYQEKIHDITGFYAFPGTLNIEVDPEEVEKLKEEVEKHVIESFELKGDNYSRVDVYLVEIEGIEAAYLDIEVTDHGDDVMEIVAEDYLREKLNIEDGDTVEITPR